MNSTLFAKQILEMQKTAFDNTFNAIATVQDQALKTSRAMQKQAVWLPDSTRSLFDQWATTFEKARSDFKKVVDDNYKMFEGYTASAEKPGKKEKSGK